MDTAQIKTLGDFRAYILALADEYEETYTGTLEMYLCALWNLIQAHRQDKVTFALLGQLLHDAFITKPLPFDESWLTYENPPPMDFTSVEYRETNQDDFSALQQMICYQNADFHRIAQTDILSKPWVILGIDSPTGHIWYNFDPFSYLRCAVQSIVENSPITECHWEYLTITLWLGQIYE